MNRVFKSCLFILVILAWCFCLTSAHAAGRAANPAQPKPEAPAAAPATSQDAPAIQAPEATYDFGEALEGVEVSHDYKIKNTGKAELQITQVRPG
jgi:hypothetical protein